MTRIPVRMLTAALLFAGCALAAARQQSPLVSAADAGRAVQDDESSANEREAHAALDALLAHLARTSTVTFRECQRGVPVTTPCVFMGPADAAAGGVMSFSVAIPDEGGYAAVMGRGPDGVWAFWFGSQQLLMRAASRLPGELLACPGAGERLNVREAPSLDAPVLATVGHEEPLAAEELLLTRPDSGRGGPRGEAWYRVGGPLAGWVNADYVADAVYETCHYQTAIRLGRRSPLDDPGGRP
jgi:hypothetical protein